MTGKELFVVCAILLALLALIIIIVHARLQRLRQEAKRKAIIHSMLEMAQAQNEIFDINLLDKAASHKGLAGTLMDLSEDALQMEVLTYLSRALVNTPVDVYFRVTLPTGPASYKFRSTIRQVDGDRKKSRIALAPPEDLSAGQKRSFIRVKPPKALVRVIGIWKLDPELPIPRSTGEIGKPLVHYKKGMELEPVQVENISATGMALRFPLDTLDAKPVDLGKDSKLLCLIIYQVGRSERVVTFWCTADVLHVREMDGQDPALVLGTAFTNWAVLEQGKSEINWFHSTPARGVSPITQWVMHMDLEQHKLI